MYDTNMKNLPSQCGQLLKNGKMQIGSFIPAGSQTPQLFDWRW